MNFNLDQADQGHSSHDYDSRILTKLRELYPDASEEQLIEGKKTLEEYVDVAWEIVDRIVRGAGEQNFDSNNENSYDANTKVESEISKH